MQPDQASQITGYSFKPYIDLTSEEYSRLSAMTRNSKDVIYVKGFLVNTKKNKNGWRITDNSYIVANKGIAAGRSINFGPKMLGKAHHPNFYHDLDLSGKTPDDARKEFLAYQEWSRIGDILRIDYDTSKDQWNFYGAISHPNIIEAIQRKELELPKYVSPYFWNLNDPEDTGDEIREAELFHVSFVDDPAYGPEVATVEQICNSSEGQACAAKVYGMPAGSKVSKGNPPCMCGLMASYNNKLDSSFYVKDPKSQQIQDMSDPSTQQPAPPTADNTNKNKDELAREAALKTMQEYDKKANEAKDLDTKGQAKAADDPNNPTIPVQYQDALNLAIEKDRAEQQKGFAKQLKEKDDRIAELEAQVTKYVDAGRETILDNYIDKDTFKDEAEYKKRREFYSNLTKELKMSNEQLEELMKGHYQVQEVKYLANKKGKGAGSELNTDPFEFNNREEQSAFGKLSSSSNNNNNKQGLAAGITTEEEKEEDTTSAAASAVASAF